jgi:hypothetical protein
MQAATAQNALVVRFPASRVKAKPATDALARLCGALE